MRGAFLATFLLMTGFAAGQVPTSDPATAPATMPAATPGVITLSATTQPGMTPASTMPAYVTTSPVQGALTLTLSTMPSTYPTTTTTAPVATTGMAGTTTAPTTGIAGATTTPAWGTTRPSYATTNLTTAPSYYGSDRYRYRDRDRDRGYTPSYVPPVPAYSGPDLRPKPISSEYYVLLRRSIFIRGRQAVIDPGDGLSSGRFYATDPGSTTSPSTMPTTMVAWSPENTMVFNGASNVNGQLVAFIENTSLNSSARFQVGDLVATGKIVAITLDQIDYSVGGRITHVMLGQNLSGIDTQVLTTQPVSGGAGPTSGPSGGSDDVLERLRRRRLQELGGQ